MVYAYECVDVHTWVRIMVDSSEMTTNPSEALNKQKSTTKTKERPKQQ